MQRKLILMLAIAILTASFVAPTVMADAGTSKHHVAITLIINPQSVSSGGTFSVSGTLKDTTAGTPLSGMKISFIASSPIFIPSTTTDSNGNYLVSGLVAPLITGSYSIQAKFVGNSLYRTYSATEELKVSPTSTPPPVQTPPPAPVSVSVTASPQSGMSPLNVIFSATPSGGSGTYTYSWNFGDGSTSSVRNPTHTYSTSGTFAAKVTVTDSTSNSGSSNVQITVTANPPVQPPQPSGNKILLALYLQYVALNSQLNIYQPNMDINDMTRLRAQNAAIDPVYAAAAKLLPGTHAVAFTSSADIVANALIVKTLGFDTVEFNLESGLSPASDNADVVGAMKIAADAAHAVGLKFRATPSKAYTKSYGPQIAAFSDYYHVQAQSQQGTCGTSSDGYKSFVDSIVPKLRAANPNLVVTVQVSTSQSAAPGLTLLQTMETCFGEVSPEVNGVSVWFGGSNLPDLQGFVQWFHANY